MSTNRTYVVGVGMTPFEKPGRRDWDYPDIGGEAARAALDDAGIAYDQVEQAVVGYTIGDSTCGQRALYGLGLSGIPVLNVNYACATGSSALYLARQAVKHGMADCVLALGFERMEPGGLKSYFHDRAVPTDRVWLSMIDRHGWRQEPATAQLFAHVADEYVARHGVDPEVFPRIAEKNHRHSVGNPYAQFREAYTLEEIKRSPMVSAPLTKLQCCPTSDGGAAAVVASARFVEEHRLGPQAVEIVGQALVTDTEASFDGSDISAVGFHMAQAAARQAYEEAGLGPEDAQVVELHDCFSANELVTYEALGLCGPGEAADLVFDGAVTHGGRWVVNPSGGLISKGHPLGATGLAQCAELTWQLRGQAGGRQVDGARVAIQQNAGLGGAGVVSVLRGPAPGDAAA